MICFFRFLYLYLFLLCCFILPAHAQIRWANDEAETQTDIAFDLQPATSGNFELRFAARDDKNFIALDCAPNTISLRRLTNGQDTVLARTSHDWKAQTRVVVQRRSWLLRAIVNNRVVLTTYDDSLSMDALARKVRALGKRANCACSQSKTLISPTILRAKTDKMANGKRAARGRFRVRPITSARATRR